MILDVFALEQRMDEINCHAAVKLNGCFAILPQSLQSRAVAQYVEGPASGVLITAVLISGNR